MALQKSCTLQNQKKTSRLPPKPERRDGDVPELILFRSVSQQQPKHNMAKAQNSKKQVKKAPLKTPKQKKAAKQAKKAR